MSIDPRILDILERFEELQAQNESPTPAELCRDCPELTDEVARRIRDLQRVPSPHDTASTMNDGTLDHGPPWPAAPKPLPSVAGYEVLEELGRGGMGVVYKARQLGLNRLVALKMIRAGEYADRAEIQRFRTEAEAVAQLQHPNIVQIHEIGAVEGMPYFSLEYVAGGTLADVLRNGPLEPKPAAALTETLARAMNAAHQRGIVHRDLKPANILLAARGLADSAEPNTLPQTAIPKIADFGLAKRLDADSGQTHTEAVMGTPSYMAPEQAAGATSKAGPAADIYALGAILYELITGRPPFRAADKWKTVEQVLKEDPVPPRNLQPGTPRDLETICLKCLQKEPGRRYGSAEALAEDLKRFLRGEPIVARSVGAMERGVRWCQRNRGQAASFAGVAISLVGGTLVSLMLAFHASESATSARKNERKASDAATAEREANSALTLANQDLAKSEAKARELATKHEDDLATATMQLARARFDENNSALADELLERVPGRLRKTSWNFLKNQFAGSLMTLREHRGSITCVVFRPDGQMLASASQDGTVRIWDAQTGHQFRVLPGVGKSVQALAFSSNGRLLASGGDDNNVSLWDVETGRLLRVLRGHDKMVSCLAFSPTDQMLASASFGSVKLWDTETGKETRSLTMVARKGTQLSTGDSVWIHCIMFSPNGTKLFAAGSGTIRAWDLHTGNPTKAIADHQAAGTCACISPDGKWFAFEHSDSSIQICESNTGRKIQTLRGHSSSYTLTLSPDGQILASAGFDNVITLWHARHGHEIRRLRGHGARITTVAFDSNGLLLASGSWDGTVKVWSARMGQELRTLRTRVVQATGNALSFHPDGQRLATLCVPFVTTLWDLRSGEKATKLKGHERRILCVKFSPDGSILATGSDDQSIKIWDSDTGREIRTLHGNQEGVWALDFSADGRMIACGSKDNCVRIWNPQTGELIHTLHGHQGLVRSVAFNLIGRVLATGGDDGMIKLWDSTNGKEIGSWSGHQWGVHCVQFASNGKWLASAGGDHSVKLWDFESNGPLRTLRGHQNAVLALAWGESDEVVASASLDGTIKLWDSRTGQELQSFRGNQGAVRDIAFRSDVQVLASVGDVGGVKLWNVRTKFEDRTIGSHLGEVNAVAFSPDDLTVVSASADRALRLWEFRTGQLIQSMFGHQDAVARVTYSANGKLLASTSSDKTVRLWDVGTGQLIRTLHGHQDFGWWVEFSRDGSFVRSIDTKGRQLCWTVADGMPCDTPPNGVDWVGPRDVSVDDQWLIQPLRDAIRVTPRRLTGAAREFRVWATSPNPCEHEYLAEQADKDGQEFAAACQLGQFLEARMRLQFFSANEKKVPENGRRAQAAFVDGPTFAGVILRDSGRSAKGLVVRAQAIWEQWQQSWRHREILGAALYRAGKYRFAAAVLEDSHKLRAMSADGNVNPSIFSCHFLTLAYHQLGDARQAALWRAKAVLPFDAPWDDAMIDRYLRREVEAELTDEKQKGASGQL